MKDSKFSTYVELVFLPIFSFFLSIYIIFFIDYGQPVDTAIGIIITPFLSIVNWAILNLVWSIFITYVDYVKSEIEKAS